MALGEEELGTLRLEATEEEVCAELEQVLRVVFEDFAVECADFVGVIAGQRHCKTDVEVSLSHTHARNARTQASKAGGRAGRQNERSGGGRRRRGGISSRVVGLR